jgi:hypothetical protein
MNILVSIILLSAAIGGFYVLQLSNAILFLIFLILAYPLALAVTIYGPTKNVVEMYRLGASQIPAVGEIIKALLPPRDKPPSNPDST